MSLKGFHLLEMNSKKASIQFNPGWGEIPEWYIQLDNGVTRTITDGSGVGDQLAAFNYCAIPEKLIENDWATLTNLNGVVRIVMDYVGYNSDNELNDMRLLNKFRESIVDELRSLASDIDDSEDVDTILKRLNDQVTLVSRLKDDVKFTETRLSVWADIEDGIPSGLRWDNASFVQLLKARKESDPTDKDVLQCLSILEQHYPEFLAEISW